MAKNAKITQEQISNYLYKEAIGELTSKNNNKINLKESNDNASATKNFAFAILAIVGVLLIVVFFAFVSRYLCHRAKKKGKK